jgi:hypothetical protein
MAEKRVIELEVKDNVPNLKQQYKEAVKEVQKLVQVYGETSQQVAEAAKRAAELKDQIEDTNDAIAAFKGEGTYAAFGKAISSVASGFSAVEGAIGLVGVESEALQETLLRVQSAMALAQGLEGLEDAGRAFKQVGAIATNTFNNMSKASKAFAITGIGLLITGLSLVIAYWDDIKSAISGVSAEQEALNVKSQKDVDLQKEKLESLDSQNNILKLQGLTEKQILQLKVKQTDEAIKAYEISIKNQEQTLKAQIQAEQRNKEILKGILQFILAPINLLLKTVDEIGAFLGKDWNLQDQVMDWTASLIFDPKEVEQEGMKAIAESKKALAELKNQQAGFQLQIQAIDKQAADARRQAQKEANDKRIADEKEKNDKLKELAEAKAKFDLEQIELDEIRQEQAYQRKLDAAAKAAEEEKAMEDALRAERLAAEEADEKRQEEAWAREQEGIEKLQELKYAAVLQGLTLISDLSEVFAKKGEKQAKRAFEIQKAASIASALISTYQSAVSAYQSQFSPLPDPTSPIRGAIAAGIAVAAGLGNVAKIASQKFEGGGAPAGGGGGNVTAPSGGAGGSVISPSFNIVGNAQATNPLAGLGGQPIQAYVVSGEVTTAQSLDRNRINYATFG